MGSSAVTEREPMTDRQRAQLLQRLTRVQDGVARHLLMADTMKASRFALVEKAKAGGVTNKDIAAALGMTSAGVVKIVERGRASDSE